MTDIQHLDIDSDDFLDAPKALRDYAKKLKLENQRLAETNGTLTGQLTATALTDVLKEFKNPERVKRDLLGDKVDPLDSGAVAKWLESNADDYAKGVVAPTTPVTPAVDDAEVQAHQQIQQGAQYSQPADMSKLEAALTELGPNATAAETEAAFRKHGV